MATQRKRKIAKEDIHIWDGKNETFPAKSATGRPITANSLDWVGVDVETLYGSRTNTAIQQALDAVGSTNEAILFLSPGTWTISANVTLTSNIYLQIAPGATITVSSGTFTIYSPENVLASPRQTIFSGTVAFTSGGTVYPDWWGADSTGASDAYTAIAAAVTSLTTNSLGGIVHLNYGTYRIDTSVTYYTNANDAKGIIFEGEGPNNTIIDSRVSGYAFDLRGVTTYSGTTELYQRGSGVRRMKITTTSDPGTADGIRMESQWFFELSDLYITGMSGNGIELLSKKGSFATGDYSLIYQGHVSQVFIYDMAGYGVLTIPDNTASDWYPIYDTTFDNLVTTLCDDGGVRGAFKYCTFRSCEMHYNGKDDGTDGAGVWLDIDLSGSWNTSFINCYMDGNKMFNILADSAHQCRFVGTKHTQQASHEVVGNNVPDKFVSIGNDTATPISCLFEQERFNCAAADTGLTVYSVGSNASYTRILDPYIINLNASGTALSNSGTSTTYMYQGKLLQYSADIETQGSGAYLQASYSASGGIGSLRTEEVEQDVSDDAGTSTWANAIPAGSVVLGVGARVTTAVEGCTSIDIGDGTTADLFVDGMAVAEGTTANLANAAAATVANLPKVYRGTTNIVLTAVGGAADFSAGVVKITLVYMYISAPTG